MPGSLGKTCDFENGLCEGYKTNCSQQACFKVARVSDLDVGPSVDQRPGTAKGRPVRFRPDPQRQSRFEVLNTKDGRSGWPVANGLATADGGIPLEDSAATINENVVNVRNPHAKAAQRIGTSTTIIVAFEGPKVPNYPENKEVKALKEANRQQAKKIAEQDAVIRRMAMDVVAMKEMIKQLQGREQKPAEESAQTAEEPLIKQKSTEGSRTRRVEEREDKTDEKINRIEVLYNNKNTVLQQHARSQERKPDVVMLPEVFIKDPKLPGYRTYAGPIGNNQRGVCVFVPKVLDSLEHTCRGDPNMEKQLIKILIGKKSVFLENIYSNPKHARQKFSNLFHGTLEIAGDCTLVIRGDFNAPTPTWDTTEPASKDGTYAKTPQKPTSVLSRTHDTPPLPETRDHCVVEVTIPLRGIMKAPRKHRYRDWDAFRRLEPTEEITDLDEEIETTEDRDGNMDSRLAHLIEAKQSLLARWRKQRLNHGLCKNVAELNKAFQEHSKVLAAQQWEDTCNAANGQMHNGATWRLLRHLLDETKTKNIHRNRMAGIIQTAVRNLGEYETKRRLLDKYLPGTATDHHPDYVGNTNERLDSDLETSEIQAALQKLNSKSAAGPDKISNKTLKNMGDDTIQALTAYFNECWRSGKLPKQWKTAKMILLPKPGKPPSIEHLRLISLMFCVGKVMEHVLVGRWQRYSEDERLYPDTMFGF
ncbi:hypothetical protein HPB47_015690 [Ixodes persulcatus]|uniref:Uncharacterized protein n=1 Tax=Ixodes persulcatus TaxID=34615 RepID=A0AC60QU25_IXOPE|nr:hypothetical protein HPB47_015690 [Ixodes persulcatus]